MNDLGHHEPGQHDPLPGEYVELAPARGLRPIRGLVESAWRTDGTLHLRVYSYAARTVTTYRVDRRGRATRWRPPRETDDQFSAEVLAEADTLPQSSDAEPNHPGVSPRGRPAVVVLALLLVTAAMVAFVPLPIVQGTIGRVAATFLRYERFLAHPKAPARIVGTVAARISYENDLEDYWSAPEDVWATRTGDCEDQALVVAAYLTEQRINHWVLGLSIRDGLDGHVIVVADFSDGRYLLDPTRATAPTGVERFAAATPLAEIVAAYAALPARDYGPSPEPGRPHPVRVVE